ncbi:MAG: hypothetical protein AAFR65_12445 [Pseudomonadota bacterium]
MKRQDEEFLPWGAVIALFPLLWALMFAAIKVLLPAFGFAAIASSVLALILCAAISSHPVTRRIAVKVWDVLTDLV